MNELLVSKPIKPIPYIFIKIGDRITKVMHSDIYTVEIKKKNYCTIFTSTEEYEIYANLFHIKYRFPSLFLVQVNQSTLVCLDKIDSICLKNNLVFIGNKSFLLSRLYRKDFIAQLDIL